MDSAKAGNSPGPKWSVWDLILTRAVNAKLDHTLTSGWGEQSTSSNFIAAISTGCFCLTATTVWRWWWELPAYCSRRALQALELVTIWFDLIGQTISMIIPTGQKPAVVIFHQLWSKLFIISSVKRGKKTKSTVQIRKHIGTLHVTIFSFSPLTFRYFIIKRVCLSESSEACRGCPPHARRFSHRTELRYIYF